MPPIEIPALLPRAQALQLHPENQALAKISDNLYVSLQRLLPTGAMARIVYKLARSRRIWLKNALIQGFVRLYGVDVEEADAPVPDGYSSFNSFFSRALKPGARPVDGDFDGICSPVDGTVQQLGSIHQGQLLQAKRFTYSLNELLGQNTEFSARYENGSFLTVYLAPHNYHRVHSPIAGTVRKMVYIPGKRLAVNRTTAQQVPGLFAGNLRLVLDCRGPWGPFAVVLVGAMNVSSISTAWAGEVLPPQPGIEHSWTYDRETAVQLDKGDHLGHFNLGSTVIVIMPPDTVIWEPFVRPDVQLTTGQRIGTLSRPA